MENPSGDYTDEYRSIKEKSEKWRNSISNQYMNRHESRLFYHSFYLPSLRYNLTIGTFTHEQLDPIQQSILQILLPRLGFNKNMPKEVVYGPTRAGGIGFVPLFVEQSTQKTKEILQAYRNNTPLQQIMHTTFQWAQRVAGTSQSIFMIPGLSIPSLNNEKWITSLRDYLAKS